MLRGALVGLASCGLIASFAHAQDADPYQVKVQALAHPRYAEREKAGRDLETAGEPALKALRAAAKSSDPEVRERAAAIAERINRSILSKRLVVAPTLSLNLDKVPLHQAITQVAQKSGLRFQLDPAKGTNLQRHVTLKTGDLPFWAAIDAFYREAGLIENDVPGGQSPGSDEQMKQRTRYIKRLSGSVADGGYIRLTEGKNDLPADNAKAMRVRALPAAYGQNKHDPQAGEITFHLDVDVAPGAEVQELIGVEVRRAIAEDRRALVPAYPSASFSPGMYFDDLRMARQVMVGQQLVIINGEMLIENGSGSASFFPVTLKAGSTRPRQLSELEGVVVARMMTPPEALIAITDIFGKGKGQSQSSEGITLSIKSADDRGSSTQATVHVRLVSALENLNEMLNFPIQVKGRLRPFIRINRRGGEPASNAPEFQLRSADGKPVKIVSTRVMESFSDGMTFSQEIELRFEKPASGVEGIGLTLAGRRSTLVEMPFTLKNVPLP